MRVVGGDSTRPGSNKIVGNKIVDICCSEKEEERTPIIIISPESDHTVIPRVRSVQSAATKFWLLVCSNIVVRVPRPVSLAYVLCQEESRTRVSGEGRAVGEGDGLFIRSAVQHFILI